MMMRFLVILLCLIPVSVYGLEKTTRRNLKVASGVLPDAGASVVLYDTIEVSDDMEVRLSGFDKPLRSNKETFFVTNKSGNLLSGLVIEFNYTDMQGRQLHKRNMDVVCEIPVSETRQITIPSWDRQQSFFYRLSAKPKRASAVPFDVCCRVVAVIIKKN